MPFLEIDLNISVVTIDDTVSRGQTKTGAPCLYISPCSVQAKIRCLHSFNGLD